MTKDIKIEKIINLLLKGTANDSIEWNISNSMFNTTTIHKYESYSIDKKTKFQIEIMLNDDFSLCLSSILGDLTIFNKNLVDGKKYIVGSTYDLELNQIKKLIYNKYIKNTLPSINDSIVLDSILQNIGSLESKRDDILNSILDDIPKESKKTIWEKLKMK